MNSAQVLKFIIQYPRRVQYNLSAKRKQAYLVRGAVEPRFLNQSDQEKMGQDHVCLRKSPITVLGTLRISHRTSTSAVHGFVP